MMNWLLWNNICRHVWLRSLLPHHIVLCSVSPCNLLNKSPRLTKAFWLDLMYISIQDCLCLVVFTLHGCCKWMAFIYDIMWKPLWPWTNSILFRSMQGSFIRKIIWLWKICFNKLCPISCSHGEMDDMVNSGKFCGRFINAFLMIYFCNKRV